MPTIAEPSAAAIEEAAGLLRAGSIVAFPTETVYGLGGDTFSEDALGRVYALKGRPQTNPLITHVLGVDEARTVATGWDDRCGMLATRFWPGPLTMVLPKAERVPSLATAGRATIGVRSPRHPVARRLLSAFAGPISAPSANRSGHISPTTARHVMADFADVAKLVILDGGRCAVGLESTVLDLTGRRPRILRPGSVTQRELAELLGDVDTARITAQAASPGTLPRHYAPQTPAEIVDPTLLTVRLGALAEPAVVLCFDRDRVPPPHRAVQMPQGAGEYGRRLYAALREADAVGATRIVIEAPPSTNDLWKVINDRLERATAPA